MEKGRSNTIVKSGILFIITNLLLAIFNVVVGVLSNSLAIISDALHSLIDGISGLLVIISEKLAESKNYGKHREKIERITTITIAIVIIVTGIHIIVESIESFSNSEAPEYSPATIIVLIASIFAKYTLAFWLKRTGQKIKSNVVKASGAETLNDAWISIAVLVSAIIYLIWKIDIEAYISILIAIVIILVGLEFIFPHLSHHHHHHLESNPDHDHCGKYQKTKKDEKLV